MKKVRKELLEKLESLNEIEAKVIITRLYINNNQDYRDLDFKYTKLLKDVRLDDVVSFSIFVNWF